MGKVKLQERFPSPTSGGDGVGDGAGRRQLRSAQDFLSYTPLKRLAWGSRLKQCLVNVAFRIMLCRFALCSAGVFAGIN